MNRKEQQAELMFQLGLLLKPLRDAASNPGSNTPQSRSKATAQFLHDATDYLNAFTEFCKGETGHYYESEVLNATRARNHFRNTAAKVIAEPTDFMARVDELEADLKASLIAIPSEIGPETLEANSPFQAYQKIKSLFASTTDVVVWLDPFMGPGLFHRYLKDLPETVEVVLVTKDQGNKIEYRSFLDISRLYAQERGPTKYRLAVESSNHDRWLRCDDQLYHLGGSAKDAGKRSDFTITKLEPTPANFQKLDNLISSATELFGPSTPTHA